MIIRKMTGEDVLEMLEIEREAFTDPWSEESFYCELSKDYARLLVAEKDGKVAGYAILWCLYEVADLANIAVKKEYRGIGIGDALMKELLRCGRESECERIMLEVRAGNTNAQRLYEKNGFKEIGIRRRYYGDGEDAVIMEVGLD